MTTQKVYPIGRIYSIRSPNINEVYIGSTFSPLSKRFSEHKSSHKFYQNGSGHKTTSFKIIEAGNAYIELIEQYLNITKEQLNKYEGHHIRANNCINKLIAGRSRKEGYNDNRNEIIRKQIKYNEINRDKLTEKFECDCGGKYTCANKSTHEKTKKHQKFIQDKSTSEGQTESQQN